MDSPALDAGAARIVKDNALIACPTKSVLIVDDDADAAAMMAELAREAAGQVTTAATALDALEMAQAQRFDLILCDVELPGMDGLELRQRLSNDPRLADIPFIFVSAQHELALQLRGLSLGALDYLVKPLDPDAALARIAYHLRSHDQNREEQVSGNLELIHCADLLQLLEQNRGTGTLEIGSPDLSGRIVLDRGAVIDALAGSSTGEDAAIELLWLRRGQFHYEPVLLLECQRLRQRGSTLGLRVSQLVMDACWLRDELEMLGDSAPKPDESVVIVDGPAAAALAFLPGWSELIGGAAGTSRRVRDLAVSLGVGTHRCRVYIGRAVQSGVITIEGR